VMTGFEETLRDRLLGINAHIAIVRSGEPMRDYEKVIEQVKIGPQRPVAMRVASTVDTADPQDASASCTQLAKADRDICKVELLVGKASDRFREQAREERRQRRAARDDRRAAPASSPLTGAVHQSAVPAR